MSAAPDLLRLEKVSKTYAATTAGVGVAVLAGVSLQVARGDSLAIVGPSGSGKSTLLQIIGTLDRATSGQVLLDGKNLATLDDLQLAEVRNRQIGFVFQAHYLLPQCTVLENVLVPTLAAQKSEVRSRMSAKPQSLAPNVCSNASVSANVCTIAPASSQVASVSAPLWSARLSTARNSCSPTNLPARSITPQPRRWASCSWN